MKVSDTHLSKQTPYFTNPSKVSHCVWGHEGHPPPNDAPHWALPFLRNETPHWKVKPPSRKWFLKLETVIITSLFVEEISACAAVHTCYIMDVCNHVWPIILLPPMMGMSFVLVALTRLIFSKPKYQVTWSYRTCVNFPFLRGERIQYLSVSA